MPIYDFFILHKEEEVAVCLTCNKTIKARKDGPSKTLVQHLRIHPEAWNLHSKLKKEWSKTKFAKFRQFFAEENVVN